MVNTFLDEKERPRISGEITPRTFSEYYGTCKRVVDGFGRTTPIAALRAEDFGRLRASLAKTRGPVALRNEITRVKMVFTFGVANGMIPTAPLYGQSFAKPKRKALDKAEAERGARDFTADEIRKQLKASKGESADPAVNSRRASARAVATEHLWTVLDCLFNRAGARIAR